MSDSETTALPRAVLNEGGRRACEDRCGSAAAWCAQFCRLGSSRRRSQLLEPTPGFTAAKADCTVTFKTETFARLTA
jgi:hypothetical protein